MKKLLHSCAAVAACLSLLACGYFSSGQWEDDSKNWQRAWGEPKPADVVVIHSWYWRSPHWTREEAYFFQFRHNEGLLKKLIVVNQMQQTQKGQSDNPTFCFNKPNWFVPKSTSDYDNWSCRGPRECWLFRDKATQELFLYACQL